MPALKITNPKISTELVEELQDEPVYQNEKAFSATHAFLRRVIHFSRDREYAFIPAKNIKEQFENYGVKYKACLNALDRHQIIEVDRQYIKGAKTRGYRLTEKGVRLMTAGEMRYVRSLFTDAKLKRQMQKRASYHRTSGKTHNDRFLQYIHAVLMRPPQELKGFRRLSLQPGEAQTVTFALDDTAFACWQPAPAPGRLSRVPTNCASGHRPGTSVSRFRFK